LKVNERREGEIKTNESNRTKAYLEVTPLPFLVSIGVVVVDAALVGRVVIGVEGVDGMVGGVVDGVAAAVEGLAGGADFRFFEWFDVVDDEEEEEDEEEAVTTDVAVTVATTPLSGVIELVATVALSLRSLFFFLCLDFSVVSLILVWMTLCTYT
jgi:hypothetical protein